MPTERQKAIRYRRALFNAPIGKKAVAPDTLEEYLAKAHGKFTTPNSRIAIFEGGFTLQIRYTRKRRNVGTLLHLAAYTDAEPASIVPHVRGQTDDAPLATAPPPSGADYMDGDLLMLVAGNDVLICASGLHERKFEQYCAVIFNNADLDPVASMFELVHVADADKAELIEAEGVKAIILDSAMFEASGANISRRSLRKTLSDGMLELFQTLFASDMDVSEIKSKENISAQLVIKFDSRKKGGELGQERIDTLAKRLLHEPSDGFKIRTHGNSVIGHDDMSLQKQVKIPSDGKTVQRDAAFAELVTYYQELQATGHLDG